MVMEVIAWGDQNMEALESLNRFDIVILSNLFVKEFKNIKHFNFNTPACKIYKNPDVPKDMANEMIKFRNDLKNGLINDIKISSHHENVAGTSLIYSIESVLKDATKRILEEGEDRIYYSCYAYLSSLSTKRNLTWRRSDHDDPIFLASCKVADFTSSTWVTLVGGGEAVLGITASEAHEM